MSSVTRLLLLAFVLFAGSAQAADYVKCEAIQKAYGRVRLTNRQLLESLSNEQLQVVKASLKQRTPSNEPRYVTEVWENEDRMDQIKADYQKAGCY